MCMGMITIHAVVIKLLNFEPWALIIYCVLNSRARCISLASKPRTQSIRGCSLFEEIWYLDYMLYGLNCVNWHH